MTVAAGNPHSCAELRGETFERPTCSVHKTGPPAIHGPLWSPGDSRKCHRAQADPNTGGGNLGCAFHHAPMCPVIDSDWSGRPMHQIDEPRPQSLNLEKLTKVFFYRSVLDRYFLP